MLYFELLLFDFLLGFILLSLRFLRIVRILALMVWSLVILHNLHRWVIVVSFLHLLFVDWRKWQDHMDFFMEFKLLWSENVDFRFFKFFVFAFHICEMWFKAYFRWFEFFRLLCWDLRDQTVHALWVFWLAMNLRKWGGWDRWSNTGFIVYSTHLITTFLSFFDVRNFRL